jgi:hypothetical protein
MFYPGLHPMSLGPTPQDIAPHGSPTVTYFTRSLFWKGNVVQNLPIFVFTFSLVWPCYFLPVNIENVCE